MPYVDQIVLANRIVPQPGGTFDVFGASWDHLAAPSVPVQQEGFALLLSVLLRPDEAREGHEVEITISAPDGAQVGRMTAAVGRIPDEQRAAMAGDGRARAEMVFNASGVVFSQFGRYAIEFLWDGEPLREPMMFTVAHEPADNASEG
jgi:hypothetical protein